MGGPEPGWNPLMPSDSPDSPLSVDFPQKIDEVGQFLAGDECVEAVGYVGDGRGSHRGAVGWAIGRTREAGVRLRCVSARSLWSGCGGYCWFHG